MTTELAIRPIRDEADYARALEQIAPYFEIEPARGTPEADRFDVLTDLIEAYEARHWPIEPAEPIAALQAVMAWKGYTQADLAALFGSRPRASEVLNRKRPLTLEQMYRLHTEWGMPADVLLRGAAGWCRADGMSAVRKLMSPETFLWCQHEDGKWELVGGEPVQMMAGAAKRHDRVVINLITALDRRLAGGPCEPHTDDVASRMPGGNIRRPDVTVECGHYEPDALLSAEPAVLFEVLSPTTESFDVLRKPDEHRGVPTLRLFVIVDPRRPRVRLFSREGDAWTDQGINRRSTRSTDA